MKTAANGYGPCHACGGPVRERVMDQPISLPDGIVIIEGVPMGVCARCGERVANSAAAKRIAALVKGRSGRRRRVPVYRYAAPARDR